ncbi:hypothetical protein AMS68_007977 [Peltaster fructicola]|uniref:HOOK N-terminal domain-containing protein n=1 Tax=Peltaster fructicola TaxID=286661 RepID=A0A6H0Y776_9PEZI|nr:hypothetical protein AMS68_007977 [Peltaster fructicola]
MDINDAGVLGESLLEWVASFDTQGTPSWRDLSDGRKLWNILREVDDEYFSDALPEPDVTPADDWTRRWQNLKHLQKQVSTYYRDVCDGMEQATLLPDLQAIAADYSSAELEKLIMAIIRTAMASPQSNQRMAQKLMSLGRERAMIIAGELRAMDEAEEYEQETATNFEEDDRAVGHDGSFEANGDSSPTKVGLFRDPLLEREEELLQSQAVIDKLQANYAVAQQQLSDLRLDKEKLQEAFDAFRDDMNGKGKKVIGDDGLRKLQQQADYDRSYIEDLETQLQSSRSAVEQYERQISRHKQDAVLAQQLRDDLQLLRSENEELNQKTKANDNLKKKIQALQEQERVATTMREELKRANERLQDMGRLKSMQAALEKEIIEKQGLIRNQEYQINELTTIRKHAEHDARVLAQKLEAAKERHERDHETLEELRRKTGESLPDHEVKSPDVELDAQLKATEQVPIVSAAPQDDEIKNLNEKLALLEQQLQAADVRLKQASQRNAEYEDRERKETAEKEKASHHIEDLEERTVELRKQLDLMSKQPKDGLTPDMTLLQRENKLMASAWYSLSNRLQSGSSGRRRQEPKSWIGKQRALVGPYNALVSLSVS